MSIQEIVKTAKKGFTKIMEMTYNPDNPRLDLDVADLEISVKTTGGNTTPILIGTSGLIYRGNRRYLALKKAGFESALTLTIDDSNLSTKEKLELLMDHNSERPLSKAEAYLSIRRFFQLGYTEAQVTRICANLLNVSFGAPAKEKIEKARNDAIADFQSPEDAEMRVIAEKHRGNIQHMKRLSTLPESIQEEYLNYWKTGKSGLTVKDIKTLSELRNDLINGIKYPDGIGSMADDKRKEIIESEMSRVNEELEKQSDVLMDINNSTIKEPTVKCHSRQDIVAMRDSVSNPIIKACFNWVLNEMTHEEFRKAIGE